MDRGEENRVKIIVRPKHERARWFKDLVRALQFAEAARRRQGAEQTGPVEVHIYDGRSPHIRATYALLRIKSGTPIFAWWWGYSE